MSIENGKIVIHAVHKRDTEKFWKKLGLKDVEDCAICGKNVTFETVGAFAPLAGKVRVVCKSALCFKIFDSLVKKKGKSG